MIKKKICMLGSFAVGKTSLVRRFVKGMFSDKYLSTVGVKIDKKTVEVSGQEVQMMLWDVAGEHEFNQIPMAYLRGMSGYLLVVDGTRRATLGKANEIRDRIDSAIGEVPHVMVVNKTDLIDEWDLKHEDLQKCKTVNSPVLRSSAKTGEGVEEAFSALATMILKSK